MPPPPGSLSSNLHLPTQKVLKPLPRRDPTSESWQQRPRSVRSSFPGTVSSPIWSMAGVRLWESEETLASPPGVVGSYSRALSGSGTSQCALKQGDPSCWVEDSWTRVGLGGRLPPPPRRLQLELFPVECLGKRAWATPPSPSPPLSPLPPFLSPAHSQGAPCPTPRARESLPI